MSHRFAPRRLLVSAVATSLLVIPLLVVVTSPPASAETLVLTGDTSEPFRTTEYPGSGGCSSFPTENAPSPNETFVVGTTTPPSGKGSLRMTSPDENTLELYRTSLYDNTPLDQINALQYSTYLATAAGQPQYLRLNVDTTGDGTQDHILLFIPQNNTDTQGRPLTPGVWQTWNAFTGLWNEDNDTGVPGGTSLAAYITAHSGATIVRSFALPDPTYDPDLAGGLSFIEGCADAGTKPWTSYLDNLVIDTDATGLDKYDLEASQPARSLTISPTSGAPGTKITVNGTDCYEPTADAVLVKVGAQSADVVASSNDNATSSGSFTASLTVPAGSDPAANYVVGATCGDGPSGAGFNYSNVSFDVTPAPATAPVPTGGNGYRMVAADGGIFTFGQRTFHGSTGNLRLNKPIVGGATDVSNYDGYWIVASDGGVFTFNAPFYGSLGNTTLSSPAVEIEPTPTGNGYWIVTADGKVYPFGAAKSFGDMSGKKLNQPIIGMSVAPDGQGYWLVSQDGGIFNFGSAQFFGSTGAMKLNAPVIDLGPMPDGQGYYLVAKDGGVFTFGSATFKGSTGAIKLNAPVVAMLVAPNGAGYWLAASDGGVFTFGAVDFLGSMGAIKLNSPVLDLIN